MTSIFLDVREDGKSEQPLRKSCKGTFSITISPSFPDIQPISLSITVLVQLACLPKNGWRTGKR